MNSSQNQPESNIFNSMIAVSNRHLLGIDEIVDNEDNLLKYLNQLVKIQRSGAKAIILREKDMSEKDYFSLCQAVFKVFEDYNTPIILHSFARVAERLHAPYLHLPLDLLKEYHLTENGQNLLRHFKAIGTSIHSVEDARHADSMNVSYMLAGNVFETECKKGLEGRGLSFIKNVTDATSIPVYALGGITPENVCDCIKNGATGGAMMSYFMKLK